MHPRRLTARGRSFEEITTYLQLSRKSTDTPSTSLLLCYSTSTSPHKSGNGERNKNQILGVPQLCRPCFSFDVLFQNGTSSTAFLLFQNVTSSTAILWRRAVGARIGHHSITRWRMAAGREHLPRREKERGNMVISAR